MVLQLSLIPKTMKTTMLNINFEAIILTGWTIVMAITFTSLISVAGSILAVVYWVSLIKNKVVNRYYKGSWIKYLTSLINKKKKSHESN